jgi:diguanylate cyclase (GGDEF)-like protein
MQALQVLCHADRIPELLTSSWGPFIFHPAGSLNELTAQFERQRFDAILVRVADADQLDRFARWPWLGQAALESAVVIVSPEPRVGDAAQLINAAVQDVIGSREATDDRLAQALRLAVGRKALERQLREALASDPTTGLPNEVQLTDRLAQLIALRRREPAPMAVLAFRLENLTEVEADHGPDAVADLRRMVGLRLRTGLRASDEVAAFGAGVFAVLLTHLDGHASAERVCDKLVTALQAPFGLAGGRTALTVKSGIARYPGQGNDARELVRQAVAEAVNRHKAG